MVSRSCPARVCPRLPTVHRNLEDCAAQERAREEAGVTRQFGRSLDGAALAAFAVIALLLVRPMLSPRYLSTGPVQPFAAFYCAGQAIASGRDPYTIEPLRACEQRMPSYNYDSGSAVEPAPLPPYTLALFVPLAKVPFALAFYLWIAVLVAALVVAGFTLSRLTRLHPALVAGALLLTAAYPNIAQGEIPPLTIGALSAAALFADRGRYSIAALFAALATVEPHVAGPVVVSMFIWLPRCRRALVGAAVAAAAVSLIATGPHVSIEYLFRVLPAQAHSEITAFDQLSLTYVAHLLGASDALALGLGSASYLLAFAGGVAAAPFLARAQRTEAWIVLLPATAVLLGGTFIHDLQIAAAIPATLLLAARGHRLPILRWVPLLILMVPWSPHRLAFIAVAAAVIVVVVWFSARNARSLALGFCLALAFAVAAATIADLPGPQRVAARTGITPSEPGSALAPLEWEQYVLHGKYGISSPRTFAGKLPQWLALVLFLVAVTLEVERTKRGSALRVQAAAQRSLATRTLRIG